MSMTMKLAKEDIDTPEKREKYTVSVVGCKRIGLLTACLFTEAGFKVIGVDADHHIINLVKKGKSPFTEPQLDALVKKHVKDGGFTATTDVRKAASASDIIIFTVSMPVDKRKKPNYSYVEKACREMGMGLRSGSLIVFQSTVGPGITETLVKETLENASGLKAGIDFGLAYSPILANPGQASKNITSHARIVGALNQQSLKVACLVLSTTTKGEIVKVADMRTAEAVKLLKSVYQDVNIALANEFTHFCEKTGIDFTEVQNAANSNPCCYLRTPGIIGGHASNNPYFLVEEAEAVNVKLRMLTLARKINEEVLDHTLHLARDALRSCGKTMRRAKIAVFGVSSCPNMKEPYGSPTKKLVNMLRKKGAMVQVYDSFFSYKELLKMGYPAKATLTKSVEGVDCIIIAVGHDRFTRLNLRRIKFFAKKPVAIVDMGHVIDPDKAEKLGFVYRGVGRGVWTR
jgi:nucleotide sugar dehydrogenase